MRSNKRRILTLLYTGLAIAGASFGARAQLAIVTQPGDPIKGTSANTPSAEVVANAIDNNTGSKYLNFDKLNTGFTVSPTRVPRSVVQAVQFVSANDAPERDPSSFTLEGSTDGVRWTMITSNGIPAFSGRAATQLVTFANSAVFSKYRVIFPTVVDAGTANSMQISEVQLMGATNTPTGPYVVSATSALNPNVITLTFSTGMGASALNTANYSVDNGIFPISASFGATPNIVNLRVDPMNYGVTYTVTMTGLQSTNGLTTDPNPQTFAIKHGAGVIRSSLVRKAFLNDGGGSTIPDLLADPNFPCNPSDTDPAVATMEFGTNPNHNNVTEGGGTFPNTEGYGTQIYGMFVPPTTGNYIFSVASDDASALYLSTDADPAHKVQLTGVSSWNGDREFVAPTGSGQAPAPLSAPKSLVAGRAYYLEVLEKEGGGGDHVEVVVQGPSDSPIANGQVGIARSMFQSNYWTSCGVAFSYLGPVSFAVDLTNKAALEADSVSYYVRADGSPNYTYQWYSNNVPIAGATGQSMSFTARPAANNAHIYAVAANAFSSATSIVSTLTVTPVPRVLDVGTRLDPNAVYVSFTKPVASADALNIANYAITNSTSTLSIASATFLGGSNAAVRLALSSPLPLGVSYTAVISGIHDTDGNIMGPNPTVVGFTNGAGINPPQGLTRKIYLNIGGGNVTDLTGNPNFPCNPDETDPNIPVMEYGTNPAINNQGRGNTENYGTWIYGIFIAPTTGDYTFAMASDDGGALYMSPDASPANKVQLTAMPSWDGAREYVAPTGSGQAPAPLSAPQHLVAGGRYYLEVLEKEGSGGDHVEVTVRKPGDGPIVNNQAGISRNMFATNYSLGCPPTAFFSTLGPVLITRQPVGVTNGELQTTTFSVALDGAPPYGIQWYSNGVAIAGATGSQFTFQPLRGANNSQYFAIVNNGFSALTSSVVNLGVIVDSNAPTVVRTYGSANFTNVTIVFSEPIALSTATNLGNYLITNASGGILAIQSVTVRDNTNVVLRTDLQTQNTPYVVVLNGITDRAGVPNALAPNTLAPFTSFAFTPGFALMEVYPTGGGNDVNNLTSHPSYPYYPRERYYITHIDSRDAYPNDSHEGYGARITGLFLPVTNGNYTFYIQNDDGAAFFGAPDDNASHTNLLINNPGCCEAFTAHHTGPIALTNGGRYAYALLYKEGTGGDYGRISIDGVNTVPAPFLGIYADPGETRLDISQSPVANVTNVNGGYVSLSILATNTALYPQFYEWFRSDGSGGFTNIPGANGPTLNYGPLVGGSDNGAVFKVNAYTPGHFLTYFTTNYIIPDTVAPRVVSATLPDGTFMHVLVTYSEPMDANPANGLTEPLNYVLEDTIGTTYCFASATNTTPTNVLLTLDTTSCAPMREDTRYTLSVFGVLDVNGNGIDGAHNSAQFTSPLRGTPFVKYQFYLNIGGGAVTDLTGNSHYPNSPDVTYYTNNVDWPQSSPDMSNYGLRVSGYFHPPVSGNYVFYIKNDDGGRFSLSTDETAANLRTIIDVGCCNGNFANPNATNITLVGGRAYYFEAIVKEAGGGDYLSIGVQMPGSSTIVPLSGDLVTGPVLRSSLTINPGFSQQPQSQVITENGSATLTAIITNAGGLVTYQWQINNGGGFTDVSSNGNTTTFNTGPLPVSSSGTQYRLIATTLAGTLTSATATITVRPDTNAPVALSAASANGTQVGVRFSEPVNATSGGEPLNYTIDGVPPISATVRPDGSNVILIAATPVNREFHVTVSNVTDVAATPNTTRGTNLLGKYWNDAVVDVGSPNPPGTHFSGKEGEIEISAGGNDVWGTGPDQFTYAYSPATNDFDVKVRVDSVQYVGSAWTKAGLNIRESLDPASRMVWFYPTPTAGSAAFEGAVRADNGGDVTDFGEPRPAVYYPAWLRLVRSGSTFTAYLSPDGTNWNVFGTPQNLPQFPSTLLVGVGVVSHVDGTAATAKFAEFGRTQPLLSQQRVGNNLVIRWDGASGILQYTDDLNSPATWTSIPGATSPYTVPMTQAHRFYRVQQTFPNQ